MILGLTILLIIIVAVFVIYVSVTRELIKKLKQDVRSAEVHSLRLESNIHMQSQHYKALTELTQARDKDTRKILEENEYYYFELAKAREQGYIASTEIPVKPDVKPRIKDVMMMNRLDRIKNGKRIPTQEDIEYLHILRKQAVITEEEYAEQYSLIESLIPPKTRADRGARTGRREDYLVQDTSGMAVPFYVVTSGSSRGSSGSSRADDGDSSDSSGSYSDDTGSPSD